jgi:hypothetical protein
MLIRLRNHFFITLRRDMQTKKIEERGSVVVLEMKNAKRGTGLPPWRNEE